MWLKIFHKAVKTGSYVFRRPFWWKKKIFENCFFLSFEQIFSRLLAKNILQIWQNCFLSVHPNTMMYNQQLHEKIFFSFWILVRTFSEFSNSFLAKVWKLFSKNWYEHFNQKNLFWKILRFFSELDPNIFWLSAKILRKGCQNCFLCVQKHVEETDFFIFFLFSLCNRTLSKTFLTCGSEFSTKLSKLFSSCSDEQYVEKNRILKIFLYQNLRIFFQSKQYFSTKLTKLLFKRWDEHFDEKMFFWKTLPQFCLRRWAKRFRQQNFSKLSKLNSTCSDEIFDEKTFFRKKFYSFFLLCSKTFLTSYNFFQSWQNCYSSGQTDILVKNIFFEKRSLKILSDFGRNVSQLSIQFLQRYCQNRFLHDPETFRGNRLSHLFLVLLYSGFWEKVIWNFA